MSLSSSDLTSLFIAFWKGCKCAMLFVMLLLMCLKFEYSQNVQIPQTLELSQIYKGLDSMEVIQLYPKCKCGNVKQHLYFSYCENKALSRVIRAMIPFNHYKGLLIISSALTAERKSG